MILKTNLTSKIFPALSNLRYFCTNTPAKLIEIVTDSKTNVSTLYLQRHPVNSLNLELLTEVNNAINYLGKNNCKGLILSSNIPNIFSAGLDLLEFYKPDKNKLTLFWTNLQNSWVSLYTAPFPTVALINGHSPAGGCLLAMSCDYRIMLGPDFTIGLNEAKIGIPVPFWFMDVMKNIIGARKTELSALTGRMYKAEEALNIGLIDEIAYSIEEGQSKTKSYLEQMATVTSDSLTITKREFRRDNVDKFLKKKDEELKFVVEFMLSPQVQKKFELYFKLLKNK